MPKKKSNTKRNVMVLLVIGIIAGAGFIAWNDGLIGTVAIDQIDEDYKDQTVTAKGVVIEVIDILWYGISVEGFIIRDAANNTLVINYDGDLPTVGDTVVTSGKIIEVLVVFYYMNASTWRRALVFK